MSVREVRHTFKNTPLLWPARLNCLGVIPQSERSPVKFRTGHAPGLRVWFLVGVHTRGNQLMFLSHIDVSLPLFLPLFPFLLKNICVYVYTYIIYIFKLSSGNYEIVVILGLTLIESLLRDRNKLGRFLIAQHSFRRSLLLFGMKYILHTVNILKITWVKVLVIFWY